MERYYSLTIKQRQILNRMYIYFGFNEIKSFEEFIGFIFKNVRSGILFENVLCRTFSNILMDFKEVYPDYYSSYIHHVWFTEDNIIPCMTVGDPLEYDPKGILRYFIKTYYRSTV